MKKIRVGVDATSVRNVWAAERSQDHGHAIKERRRSVLTNQCLGKETNAEPPGRGTESFLPDGDKLIVEILGSHFLRLRLHCNHDDSKSMTTRFANQYCITADR